MSNYYNYQYFCGVEVGSPPQRLEVILDTGSHHLWLPAYNCSNCPDNNDAFDIRQSSSAVPTERRDTLTYGKGMVKGFYVSDQVQLGASARMDFLLADMQWDTQHSQADGIMGLSNYRPLLNLFELAQAAGQLSSALFGFRLGRQELRQQSLFMYNLSEADFP